MRQEALRFISGYRRNNIIDISKWLRPFVLRLPLMTFGLSDVFVVTVIARNRINGVGSLFFRDRILRFGKNVIFTTTNTSDRRNVSLLQV